VKRNRVQPTFTWPLEQHSSHQVVLHRKGRTSEGKLAVVVNTKLVNGEKVG
jgi:hypothetical protein